jgi:hypothetical protein
MLELTDLVELLANFVGLLVIMEIDNWTGLMFEMILENHYEEIIK